MRREFVIAAIGLFFVATPSAAQPGRSGTRIQPGQECPPGTTEVRPNVCQAPELPGPSILDYRPKSTLVTAAHPVQKSKFPSIDFHGHPGDISSAEALERLGNAMDSIGVQVMIAANNSSGDQLKAAMAAIRASGKMKDRVRVLTGVSFRDMTPGWQQRVITQLEADVAAGAVGVGEIGKGFGLSTTKPDGSRLKLDDPDLKPIWEACARLGLPVFIHTGDPAEFFKEISLTNERWLELALFPGRRFPAERFPSFETLVAERNNLFRSNPRTMFVTAHMGWQANDLGALGKVLDEMPNVYTEVGAVLYDIGRQPRGAHDFFVKYQDRILFGKDSFQPSEYPYYWRVFETRDEYFDYYRDYHAFWKLYGIDLPDAVLKKVYYQNALKLMKGVPAGAFPR
jgi:predicted TIM-barrel fold metal-dependent hydrolase